MLDPKPYKIPSTDLFYAAKFDTDGNVRPGWDYKTWLNFWWENVAPTSSKNCHTATRPHNPKRRPKAL